MGHSAWGSSLGTVSWKETDPLEGLVRESIAFRMNRQTFFLR